MTFRFSLTDEETCLRRLFMDEGADQEGFMPIQ